MLLFVSFAEKLHSSLLKIVPLYPHPSAPKPPASESNSMLCFNTSSSRHPAPRVVLHIDMDCFFVSVSLLSKPPHWKDEAVVVCHDSAANVSSSCISSANYKARKLGRGGTKGEYMKH